MSTTRQRSAAADVRQAMAELLEERVTAREAGAPQWGPRSRARLARLRAATARLAAALALMAGWLDEAFDDEAVPAGEWVAALRRYEAAHDLLVAARRCDPWHA